MKLLNLKDDNDELRFEQYMNVEGEWESIGSGMSLKYLIVEKLEYESNLYDYYIGQTSTGIHTLFRNGIRDED